LGRFLRGRLPDRNPLRRRSDRLETAILAVLLAVLCVTAPIAAVAASAWESGISLRELHVQQVTSHKVKATLLDDAQNTGAYPVTLAEAAIRWTTPDGQIVTGMMRVPADAKAGSVTWIWINASGQLVTPLLRTDIPGRDDLAATAAVAALSAVALLAGLAIHRTMHRHRLTAWGVDWMVTEPRWNSRR
jgi:hypothetical protein